MYSESVQWVHSQLNDTEKTMFNAIKNIPATDDNIWIAQRIILLVVGTTAATITGGWAVGCIAYGISSLNTAWGMSRRAA